MIANCVRSLGGRVADHGPAPWSGTTFVALVHHIAPQLRFDSVDFYVMGRLLHLARCVCINVLVFVAGCIDESALSSPPARPCDGGACDAGADAGADARGAPVACAPGDVSGFVPTWRPPTGAWQGKCTALQVETYVGCLFSQAQNDSLCRDYLVRSDNAVCSQCLLSALDDPAYGPFVRLGPNAITVNVEGCVALITNDAKSSGCGAKAQAVGECRSAACAPSCPLSDQASVNVLHQCEAAADKSVCKSYLAAAACLPPLLEGAAAQCAAGPTPLAVATNVAKLFCASQ